ncbi:MAG: hypothetical protein P4L56_08530 [Candidatus Sulfopaludibacter sp.]|nr:hypothetical protein [Candidatus Sulfopaludibacter sp.]
MRRPTLFGIACSLLALPVAHAQPVRLSIPAWIETGTLGATSKFEATLNGKPAEVSAQLGPASDQMILVVMDVTGDPSLVDPAREALISEISKLPRNAWVGLLRAQDGLHVLADPAADRGKAIAGIRDLPNSGNPGLLETVQPALTLADALVQKSPVRVSVLYVTDGNIYRYREDYTNPVINQSDPHDLSRRFPEALIEEKISKLLDATAALQAPLFVIHLHNRTDRLNRAYQNGLQTLAEATGGRTELCRSVAEIPEAISATFARMSSEWRLTLRVPPKVHGLAQVRLSARSGDEALRLSWRSRVESKERQKNGDRAHPNRTRSGI